MRSRVHRVLDLTLHPPLSVSYALPTLSIAVLCHIKRFTDVVLEKLKLALLGALDTDSVLTAKLCLRSLACLTTCQCLALEGVGGLIQLLDTLLDAATANYQGNGSSITMLSADTQVLLYLLSHTLPYCNFILHSSPTGQALLLRANTLFTSVITSYSSPFSTLGPLAIFHAYAAELDEEGNQVASTPTKNLSCGPPNEAAYDSLYDALCIGIAACSSCLSAENSNSGINITAHYTILTPWTSPLLIDLLSTHGTGTFHGEAHPNRLSLNTSTSSFSMALSNIITNNRVGLSIRNPVSGAPVGSGVSTWLYPRFSLLDSQCGEIVTNLLQVLPYPCRATLVGYLSDLLHFFEPKINDDGTRLGSIELLCKHLNAVQNIFIMSKSMAPTSDSDSNSSGSIDAYTNLSILPLLCELLMQILLQVPADSGRSGQVFRVILEMSKLQPSFSPLVATCTSQCFYALPEMDAGSIRLFAKWLSMHLLNTQLVWPYWATWVTDVEEEGNANGSQKSLFCRLVIDHLGRAVMGDTVRANVPPQLHDSLPANPTPLDMSFVGSVYDLTGLYDVILELVEAKAENDDVLSK